MKKKQPTNSNRLVACGLVSIAAVSLIIFFIFMAPALGAPDGLASKQAEAAKIEAEIATINQNAEQAIERYDEANVELASTNQKIADNEKSLGAAEAKLKVAQARLGKRLAGIYRDGRTSMLEVILSTQSFSDFIARVDLLGKIGDQDRNEVEAVLGYKAEVEKTQADLTGTRQKQQQVLKDLADQRSQVETQLAARQAVLSNVQGDIAQMVARQEQQQWQGPASDVGAGPGAGAASPPAAGTQPPAAPDPGTSPAPAPPPTTPPTPAPRPAPSPPPSTAGGAAAIAMKYLGVPYVWGGASPSGFDCSGLVLYVYAQLGISLPHSAAAQYYSGTPIDYSQLQPGDLVFFYQPISHVGIYIGGGRMIHAPYPGGVVSIANVGGPGGDYAGACRL